MRSFRLGGNSPAESLKNCALLSKITKFDPQIWHIDITAGTYAGGLGGGGVGGVGG